MEQYINVHARSKYCDVCDKSYTGDECLEKNEKAASSSASDTSVQIDALQLDQMLGIYVWYGTRQGGARLGEPGGEKERTYADSGTVCLV